MTGHHDHPETPGSVHPEDLDLYALDALPESESDAVEDILVSASSEQQASMRAHITSTREIAAELVADAGIDVPPPPALRSRVLDLAAAQPRRRDRADSGAGADSGTAATDDGSGGADEAVTDLDRERERRRPLRRSIVAAVAASVVLLAGGVVIGRMTDGAGTGTGEQVPVADPPTQTMPEPVSELLTAPDLEMSRGEVTGAGSATVLASRSVDMAVITMSGLQDPGQGRAYQLWLMGPDHDPIPSGTMAAGQLGPSTSARLAGITDSAQVGLTEEPAGGSSAPTGDVLLALDLA